MVAELPIDKPKRVPFFTKENAKHYHAKALEAKRLAAIERQKAIEAAQVVTEMLPDEKYRLERIARTREQIQVLDQKLSKCNDPKDIKAFCESIAKLADLERMLSMRPNPGSYRPSKPRTEQSSSDATPL